VRFFFKYYKIHDLISILFQTVLSFIMYVVMLLFTSFHLIRQIILCTWFVLILISELKKVLCFTTINRVYVVISTYFAVSCSHIRLCDTTEKIMFKLFPFRNNNNYNSYIYFKLGRNKTISEFTNHTNKMKMAYGKMNSVRFAEFY